MCFSFQQQQTQCNPTLSGKGKMYATLPLLLWGREVVFFIRAWDRQCERAHTGGVMFFISCNTNDCVETSKKRWFNLSKKR